MAHHESKDAECKDLNSHITHKGFIRKILIEQKKNGSDRHNNTKISDNWHDYDIKAVDVDVDVDSFDEKSDVKWIGLRDAVRKFGPSLFLHIAQFIENNFIEIKQMNELKFSKHDLKRLLLDTIESFVDRLDFSMLNPFVCLTSHTKIHI